jgi:2-polyprenyl-3-methyl-5-hydroxy-6-metoxy-1,4-benzoquinol methylase
MRSAAGKEVTASASTGKRREYPYRAEFDPALDSPKSRAVRLVGPAKSVLDLGCGPGILAKPLVDQGCAVTGIEGDPDAAREAQAVCERVIVADLDDATWMRELGSSRFDVVTANNVLEHLEQPGETLRRLRRFIKPGGYVVASISNVAHGSLRLALLGGEFEYRDLGLLDRTHLRFFTRKSIEELFSDAGYVIRALDRFEKPIDATEIPVPKDTPPELLEALAADEDARTYVFIVSASPIRHGSEKELRSRVRVLIEENDGLRKQLNALARPVEIATRNDENATGDRAKRRIVELRATALDLRRQVADRQKQIEAIQAELLAKYRAPAAAEMKVAALGEEIAALKDAVRVRTTEAERTSGSLRQTIEAREAEVAELRSRVLQLSQTPRTTAADEERLRLAESRVRELEQELQSIRTSHWWRTASLYWSMRRRIGMRDRKRR